MRSCLPVHIASASLFSSSSSKEADEVLFGRWLYVTALPDKNLVEVVQMSAAGSAGGGKSGLHRA